MKPTPADWPRISSGLSYRDAAKAIDWLCEAFGFEVRLKVEGEGGRIEHSELTYGEGLIMVGQERDEIARFGTKMLSPLTAGGVTQSLMIYVDDVDAHCERARKAGAQIVSELTYGEGLIMVGQERDEIARFGTKMLSPLTAGGVTQSLMIYVDDVDAHCERARKAGAQIVSEPTVHDYGDDYWADRSYGALDLEGHMWWVSQRIRG